MSILLMPEDAPRALTKTLEALIAQKGLALIALDGMAASGKTTLASALYAAIPGCCVVHMDDFFLPQQKRTREHYARTLAWADVQRVRDEILAPLSLGEDAVYRPYVHHPEPRFLDPVRIPKDVRAVIVEGAYSLNPALYAFYDLRLLMTVSAQTQQSRIRARNGEALLAKFVSEWIPMENRHIDANALTTRVDAIIRVP